MINKLSIIIPTYNEEKYLPKLLNSIARQDFTGKLEIIVVDGASTDATVKVAKSFKQKFSDLSIIALRKRGISYQKNKGAEKAKYNHLLFIDSDIILPKHFLNRFIKNVVVRDKFIETANVWIAEKEDILSQIVFSLVFPLYLFLALRNKVAPGFLLLTTKENHLQIQGFREDLKLAEDVDYSWRSKSNGAHYHLQIDRFVLHSARRPQKIGRWKFVYDYIRGFYAIKKYGIEACGQMLEYPFGNF